MTNPMTIPYPPGTTPFPPMADTVLIRHVCHCDGAVDRPAADDAREHRFEVNGEDFPWLLDQCGPVVTRFTDNIWRIKVNIIIGIQKSDFKAPPLSIGYAGYLGQVPVIGGTPFPWLMDDQGWTLTAGHKVLPTVSLGFYAGKVDTNDHVEDLREEWADRALFANGGDLFKTGKDHCFACGDWVDDSFEHVKQSHPEYNSKSKGVRTR